MAVGVGTGALGWAPGLRPSVVDFQGIGVYRSDGCLGERRGTRLRAPVIVSMSPPGYPSAMVASLQCLLPFRLAGLLYLWTRCACRENATTGQTRRLDIGSL